VNNESALKGLIHTMIEEIGGSSLRITIGYQYFEISDAEEICLCIPHGNHAGIGEIRSVTSAVTVPKNTDAVQFSFRKKNNDYTFIEARTNMMSSFIFISFSIAF
jgi:hypothetical protein